MHSAISIVARGQQQQDKSQQLLRHNTSPAIQIVPKSMLFGMLIGAATAP